MTLKKDSRYPVDVELARLRLRLTYMCSKDVDAILHFAEGLSSHDLLFLRRDIKQRDTIEDWLMDIDAGHTVTILANQDDRVIGYATVQRRSRGWSSHVAELRVAVATEVRGNGVGRLLTEEALKLARSSGVEKMMARMTHDQLGAIAVFEELGFEREALLRNHVKDLAGATHDLVMMSHSMDDLST